MVLSDYEPVDGRTTKGQFCDTVLVKSRKTAEILAMKKYSLENSHNRNLLKTVLDQSSVLADLVHRFIVRFHESFFDANNPSTSRICVVIERCEGGTISQRLIDRKMQRSGPFPAELLLKWAAQMLSAVAYLHDANFIHADIKPEKLYLTNNDNVKLGDLESLRPIGGSNGEIISWGTPAYMALETFNGELSVLCDEWSVGAVLFQLATLETPFGDSINYLDIANNIAFEKYTVPVSSISSAELRSIVSKLLARDLKKRSTAKDVLRMSCLKNYRPGSEYAINEKLGEGSYGIVYKVTCNDTGQIFVMKRIQKDGFDKEDFIKAKQEILALCKLNHPNIVGYRDSFEDEDGYCLIMELCGGGTLFTELRNRKMDSNQPFGDAQILRWGGQLLDAIAYIHDQNIIHRDIKPENVLLSASKDVKLGDFGGVKIIVTGGAAGTFVGTNCYIAPDVVEACTEEKTYGKGVDIWSAGILLFELATLRLPINAKTVGDLFSKLQQKAFDVPLSEINSPVIRSIVEKMLVFSPQERWDAKKLIPLLAPTVSGRNSPKPATPTLLPLENLQLGKCYEEIEDLSNQGVFGRCAVARDHSSQSLVVLKIRQASLMLDKGKADMLKQEVAKLAGIINHRNLMSYKRHFETPDKVYVIVLEHLKKGSLARAIASRKGELFPEQQLLNMAAQLNAGLQFLHDRFIIHKRVKPSNIFFRNDTWVKLGDLGIVEEQLGVDALVISSPNSAAYLAPELVSNGRSAIWKFKTDMWAFGCVLYEAAALRRAFQDPVALMREKIKNAQYPPLPAGRYSPVLSRLITSLLHKDPGSRISSQEVSKIQELSPKK